MSIKIYNTLTRKKEEFQTLIAGKVGMYVCGPTVYSKAHVGHAMSALVFDIIRRYLEYRGYQVKSRDELHRRGRQDHQPRQRAGSGSLRAGRGLHPASTPRT